jgi:polysaccharide biosynthesis/export protein
MNFSKPHLLIVGTIIVFNACVPQKNIEYMRDTEHLKTYTLQEPKEQRIKPNDELYIRVSSFDEVAFNFFNNQTESRSTSMTDQSVSLISYVVNKNGNIYFPILGEVEVENLTLLEATDKLKKLLSDYFNQPTVLMKFVNKKVTVLGAVQQPGHYTFTENIPTILQVIGMAGGFTESGNRKEVTIIRHSDKNVQSIHIDLSKISFITSEYYFVHPNDIIYIKPLRSAKWNINAVPINLLLTSVTTFLLILNYINK